MAAAKADAEAVPMLSLIHISLPIQRIPQDDAVKLVRRAFERGINFFDTARSYTDSEAKLGVALKGIREQVFIATKTPSVTAAGFWNDLETSLRLLQTDYIDIYQFHNPAFCPKPGDGSGLYEAMQQAREQGKIRFIGITNHRLAVAGEAIESDLYATLQFPFSYLTTEKELELVRACAAHGMGFIAMKALAGGLINNSAAAYAYLAQFDHVLPIWGCLLYTSGTISGLDTPLTNSMRLEQAGVYHLKQVDTAMRQQMRSEIIDLTNADLQKLAPLIRDTPVSYTHLMVIR